jgi:hypothetical protein
MTVINGIEIDNIVIYKNNIKETIINNDPIEDKLHVIIVISNPCLFARRYILAREFIKRMENEENVILYVVELAYKNQQFIITEKNNKNHLQLRTNVPIWHKENMINLVVKNLLPPKWKAFAWVDADIDFESPTWALDTLKLLNGSYDIVQLWSHAVDMNPKLLGMSVFNSAGFQYSKNNNNYNICKGVNYWHPGYAWAMTRKAYEKIGGLYEVSILGSGDNIMMLSIINNGIKSLNEQSSDGFKKSVGDFQKKMSTLRFGYVPGVIRHFFHGSKKNRKYSERWKILIDHQFDPNLHLSKDEKGLLVPSEKCPKELLDDILLYFKERNEDEGYYFSDNH